MNNDSCFTKAPVDEIGTAVAFVSEIIGDRSRGRKSAPLDSAGDTGPSRRVFANTISSASLNDWIAQLSAELVRLELAGVEILLIDLTLPRGHRIAVFNQLFQAAPGALVLIHLYSNGPKDPATRDSFSSLAPSSCRYRLELTWLDRSDRLAVASRPILRHQEPAGKSCLQQEEAVAGRSLGPLAHHHIEIAF